MEAGLKVQDEGLQSSHPEGVGAAAMDCSNGFLFVADTNGYIHSFKCALRQGVLLPVTLLARTPPAGSRLVRLCPSRLLPSTDGFNMQAAPLTNGLMWCQETCRQAPLRAAGAGSNAVIQQLLQLRTGTRAPHLRR